MNTEPVVFLTHETDSDRDLSSAQRYGKLRPLLNRSDKPGKTPGPCLWKIMKALRDEYDSARDYICIPGGDPVAGLLTGMALATLRIDEVKMLRYERERDLEGRRKPVGFYVPVSCKLLWGENGR